MATFPELVDDFLISLAELPLDASREDVNVALFDCFRSEQQLRHWFAQFRQHPKLTADPYLGLIDIFELHDNVLRSRPRSETEAVYVWSFSDGSTEEFPTRHLLPLGPDMLRPRGSRAIVPTLEMFQRNFEVFTHGALSRLPNWDNMAVAGGSVLGCLSPPLSSSTTNFELNELYQSSAYQGSDIDLFLYGITHSEIYDPDLPSYPQGLSLLLVGELEIKRPAHYVNLHQKAPRVPRSRRLPGPVTIQTADLKELLYSNNYEYFRVPYFEGINALKIHQMVQSFDKKANSKYNKANEHRNLHRHAVFSRNMMECLGDFCVNCPSPQNADEERMIQNEVMYIRGPARFIESDPGRQMIGSFNPITIDDWTEGAYRVAHELSQASEEDVPMEESN
ncbi:hypothetical protein JR316_0000061 [Psilocybe cubensis]|uniref:Uncharacterized protein n=2 Tax=Psilocybe cubensis TaxID=181762 RepID=A0A8H7Y9M1_PSICU|nr:hypothetical protein JR316_0000061 [Psilocybe cubensis]KAH9485998.1 hypothetical protein JR316_0000061 [Psilocybe cubensis]